jgi:hypothetical protein
MSRTVDNRFFLQFALGIMFLALGILGISSYSSDLAQVGRALGNLFGSSSGTSTILVSVIQLAAGLFLLIDLFAGISSGIVTMVQMVIFVLFLINLLLRFFFNGFLEPGFFPWLAAVGKESVILAAIWVVRGRA